MTGSSCFIVLNVYSNRFLTSSEHVLLPFNNIIFYLVHISMKHLLRRLTYICISMLSSAKASLCVIAQLKTSYGSCSRK